MFILITGGCKSGKSSLAENIICKYNCKRFYIATMQPFGEEAQMAINRHRIMRSGKNFVTVEQYTDIENAEISVGSAVLLECMGNLCANEIFDKCCKNATEKIVLGIKKIIEKTEIFIAVTSQISSDGIIYHPETNGYISELCRINTQLAELADIVIEVVYGIPVLLKGELPV